MSSGFWFVDRNNKEQGPVGKDDIVGMIRAGSINRESHIWSAGLNDWKMAGQVEDFAAHFLPAGPPARNLSVDPKRQALIVLQDKRAITAALILAASFLPFVGGLAPVSIVGIHSSVTAMNQALGLMMRFGSTGRGQGAPPIGDITAALDILLVLYVVPISAIVVLFAALTTGRSRFWAFLNGLMSVALPIVVPLIAVALVTAALPKDIQALFGQSLSGFDLNNVGVGFWAIACLGLLQIFFSFRRS